jgi:hypothetical protein
MVEDIVKVIYTEVVCNFVEILEQIVEIIK